MNDKDCRIGNGGSFEEVAIWSAVRFGLGRSQKEKGGRRGEDCQGSDEKDFGVKEK